MSVFDSPAFAGHEQVVFCHDRPSGLSAIVAVHSTARGPACGGCRMYPYLSVEHALTDVLRLSYAMTLKAAAAGLPLGGGKSVIIGDPLKIKSPELLHAFGRQIQHLAGRYIAAEDVGMGIGDLEIVGETTAYVTGTSRGVSASGDPSWFTARGVLQAMRAAVACKFGEPSLAGLTVAVQGLGNVGASLCSQLHEAGAKLIVSDLDTARAHKTAAAYGATMVEPGAILGVAADVLSPCALGAILDDASIDSIRAQLVVGAANNQLAERRHGDALHARGIVFIPDFVASAGGVINGSGQIIGRYDRQWALDKVDSIYDTVRELCDRAAATARPPYAVAEVMALERVASATR